MIGSCLCLCEFVSSNIASRTFCSNCGTIVSYRNKEGKHYFNAGLFDGIDFKVSHIYDEDKNKKPSWI